MKKIDVRNVSWNRFYHMFYDGSYRGIVEGSVIDTFYKYDDSYLEDYTIYEVDENDVPQIPREPKTPQVPLSHEKPSEPQAPQTPNEQHINPAHIIQATKRPSSDALATVVEVIFLDGSLACFYFTDPRDAHRCLTALTPELTCVTEFLPVATTWTRT